MCVWLGVCVCSASVEQLDKNGYNALSWCLWQRDAALMARMILESHPNPSKLLNFYSFEDVTAMATVHWAVENGSLEYCHLALYYGADPMQITFHHVERKGKGDNVHFDAIDSAMYWYAGALCRRNRIRGAKVCSPSFCVCVCVCVMPHNGTV